eukprot:Gb_07063 [translate_table: standard]
MPGSSISGEAPTIRLLMGTEKSTTLDITHGKQCSREDELTREEEMKIVASTRECQEHKKESSDKILMSRESSMGTLLSCDHAQDMSTNIHKASLEDLFLEWMYKLSLHGYPNKCKRQQHEDFCHIIHDQKSNRAKVGYNHHLPGIGFLPNCKENIDRQNEPDFNVSKNKNTNSGIQRLRNLPPNGDGDVEEPNAGVEDAPKAGVEEPNAGTDVVPNAGVDEAPKVGADEAKGEGVCGAPKTPVDVPPNIELPVCAPNGLVFPKGLGVKGLVLAVLACPNAGCAPNGLELGCPNAGHKQ